MIAVATGAAKKQPVFSARRDSFHFAFDRVVVDGESIVVDEAAKLRPLVQRVADGLADQGHGLGGISGRMIFGASSSQSQAGRGERPR